ncbi:6885_t:CDS:2 [Dentiscutata heterogama]|uniref:6885_t:CDS:1 n=1 Tax=Dentiscutata heterogama TaxID=1316150 RepID=A0ACA9K0R8_9GLOM|nr:6885_t:CDS:2 [Dentiscutata heterogama]
MAKRIRQAQVTLLEIGVLNETLHYGPYSHYCYTCQSDTFYTKTPVYDPSTDISSIYTNWHKGGSGHQSSLIHMYSKKQGLYISSIENNICKIEVYQDSQLKQAVEGASPNNVWEHFSISKYIGVQLFGLDYAITQ